MTTVYVVAWEHTGGGGFDWYHTPEAADRAFVEERKNCESFASDGWKAARFDFNATDVDSATNEIDGDLAALFDAAPVHFPEQVQP